MNKALVFHMRLSVKNTFKQTLKRPLKTLGILAALVYFAFLPFMFKDMIVQFGLDNTEGFVLINSVITLYLSMPTTLTYFKRNGVNFKKPDVNFMFASPISPKQVLFYGLMKQAYLKVFVQLIAIIAAVYIFNISLTLAIIYGILSLVISSLLEYSLAIILYASESLTDAHKKLIKTLVYVILLLVTIFVVYSVYIDGLSLVTISSIMQNPIIVLTPIFGWKLGLLNLFFLSPNIINIVATILYVLAAFVLFVIAYKMECQGDYYEDGIKFTEQQAKILEKKGNISFSEAFGKKQKIHKYEGSLKGSGAKAIFHKQVIELRRVRRFFLTLGDLMMIGLSIGIKFIFFDDGVDTANFFMILCFVSIYLALFFQPNKRWKDEFTHYFMYLIPDSNWKKLWYATLLELIHIVTQALLLTLPIAFLVQASPLTVIMAVLVQVAIKVMMTYKSILFEGYIASKLGVNVTQLVSLMLSIFIVIIPGILIFVSMFVGNFFATVTILIYCGILTAVFMYFCTKAFNNIENLTGN